jgi:hypothetical protein
MPSENCGPATVPRSIPVVSGANEVHRPGRPAKGAAG